MTMTKARKLLSIVMAFLFMAVTCLSILPVQAMAKKTVLPKMKLISGPKAEYEIGERVTIKVNAPNYKGNVQYRVTLWDGNKKAQRELWPSMPGYYYTNWIPKGPSTFTIGWPIMEPGPYSVTVLVRRAGSKSKYDDFVKTTSFIVKAKEEAKEINFEKAGETYGPQDSAKVETIEKDIYIKADKVTLRNLNVVGNIIVDPGKDGTAALENVTAKTIKVLSGAENSIHLKDVIAEKIEAASKDSKVRIEIQGTTKIETTVISEDTILENKEGTFGKIIILKNADGKYEVELRGKFVDTIVVEGDVILKAAEKAEIAKIEIAPENKNTVVTLSGNFGEVVVKNETKVVVADGSTVKNIEVNAKAEITVEKGAVVAVLDKNNNEVKIDNQGTVTKQENTGAPTPGTGGTTGGGGTSGGGSTGPVTPPVKEKGDVDKLLEQIVTDFNGSSNLSSRATAAYDYTNKKGTVTIIRDNETIRGAYNSLKSEANASDTGIFALLKLVFNDNVKINAGSGEITLSSYIANKLPAGKASEYFANKDAVGLATYLKSKDYDTLVSLIKMAVAPDKTTGVPDVDLHTITVYGQKLDYIKVNDNGIYNADTKTVVTIDDVKSGFGISTTLGDANYATAFVGDKVEIKLGANIYTLEIK